MNQKKVNEKNFTYNKRKKMKTKSLTELIHVGLNKIKYLDEVIAKKSQDIVFGKSSNRIFTEPAKLENKITRTIYPKCWNPDDIDMYNEWCQTYRVSRIYHIKQTNNIEWK
jgi:hypothetical protein